MKKKTTYILYKAVRLYLLSSALNLILMAVLFLKVLRGEKGYLPAAVVAAAVYIGMILYGYFRIWKPYRDFEKRINLFLMGYSVTGIREQALQLTPATEKLQESLITLIESDRLLSANKRQAQYLALQNQINPHFLYNTLESIRSEAMECGMVNVMNMTEALADFFRYSISKVENMVTLEEELQNIDTYFYIQKYRFEDRIHLKVEYDEADRDQIMRCLLPKLTLQPVVENAIIHGIESKMGPGTVRITITCTEKRLLIRISDDGIGMPPETFQRLNQQLSQPVFESIQLSHNRGGIALVNVNNRIHLIFGEQYGMSVNSTEGIGTDVMIDLPIVTSRRQIPNREELLS